VISRKPQAKKGRLVWRISAGTPNGRWVDPDTSPIGPHEMDLLDVPYSWASSSFDLLNGCDVSDEPDTLTNAQLDELFPPNKSAPGAAEA
jgi:hypothetical protein